MKDSNQRLRPTYSLEEDRLNALKQILPEAFADGKINFDTLRELLGDEIEDERDEHFGLSWTGKREARRLAGLPSKGTLVPVAGEGVDEATTENIFIEGDNLEVLKLLHKSYRGKIKMIYIDPPYNTGNDFIYKDDYREPLESYLERSGQMTDAGELLSSNPKSTGRFHSNWLNMMYPRLRIAKNLLREDGYIFISIDSNEVSHLMLCMNEIFGEENFVECIIWQKKYGGGAKTKYFVTIHEYILCYVKDKNTIVNIEKPYSEENRKYYKFKDEKFQTRGPYRLQPLATNSNDERPNLRYPILYNGVEVLPEKQWQWSEERTLRALENNEIVFTQRNDGSYSVNFKQYLYDEDGQERMTKPFSIVTDIYTQHGTMEIKQMFGDGQIFSFPKPSKLIYQLLEISTQNDDIVLDLFSGSGTTASAVITINKEDKGNRKFICIQIPEETPKDSEARKAGYERISEVTKERIRRTIKKIKSEQSNNSPLLAQAESSEAKQDLGFKVFRLEHSNFRAWTDFTGQELSDFRPLLEAAESPFVSEASPDGILTEILLLEGFPLNSKTEIDPAFERNKVMRVSSEFSEHRLFITLDEEVWEETIDHAAELEKNDIFICLDNALSDENKVRLADVCRLKTI